MNTVSAVSGDSAVVISTTEIVCIDLPTRAIRWRKPGSFQGSPAISNGWVYGIQDKRVTSFSLAAGDPGPVATVPETITSGQPLLLMDHLFVAGEANTYVIDRATSSVIRTLPGGGLLSFADGHLLVAGTDGTLRSWYACGRLEFVGELPPVFANDRGDDSLVDVSFILSNPEGYQNPMVE